MERRRFTREFKLEAVRLIRDRGVSYARASEDLKVHPTELRNSALPISWVTGALCHEQTCCAWSNDQHDVCAFSHPWGGD